jgi:hypothetical protein
MDETPEPSWNRPQSRPLRGLLSAMPVPTVTLGPDHGGIRPTVTCGRCPSYSRSPQAHLSPSAGGRPRQCSELPRTRQPAAPRRAASPGIAIHLGPPACVARPRRAGSAVRASGQMAFNHDRKCRLTCADCLLRSDCLTSLGNLYCLMMDQARDRGAAEMRNASGRPVRHKIPGRLPALEESL